jgi:hypothetical protein
MTGGFPINKTGYLLLCQFQGKMQLRASVKTFTAMIAGFRIKNIFIPIGCSHIQYPLGSGLKIERNQQENHTPVEIFLQKIEIFNDYRSKTGGPNFQLIRFRLIW